MKSSSFFKTALFVVLSFFFTQNALAQNDTVLIGEQTYIKMDSVWYLVRNNDSIKVGAELIHVTFKDTQHIENQILLIEQLFGLSDSKMGLNEHIMFNVPREIDIVDLYHQLLSLSNVDTVVLMTVIRYHNTYNPNHSYLSKGNCNDKLPFLESDTNWKHQELEFGIAQDTWVQNDTLKIGNDTFIKYNGDWYVVHFKGDFMDTFKVIPNIISFRFHKNVPDSIIKIFEDSFGLQIFRPKNLVGYITYSIPSNLDVLQLYQQLLNHPIIDRISYSSYGRFLNQQIELGQQLESGASYVRCVNH